MKEWLSWIMGCLEFWWCSCVSDCCVLSEGEMLQKLSVFSWLVGQRVSSWRHEDASYVFHSSMQVFIFRKSIGSSWQRELRLLSMVYCCKGADSYEAGVLFKLVQGGCLWWGSVMSNNMCGASWVEACAYAGGVWRAAVVVSGRNRLAVVSSVVIMRVLSLCFCVSLVVVFSCPSFGYE